MRASRRVFACQLRTRKSPSVPLSGYLMGVALIVLALAEIAPSGASTLLPLRDTCSGAARADWRAIDAKAITRLCRGAALEPAPADCLDLVVNGDLKSRDGQYLTFPQAIDLCAGTIRPSARIDCFRQRHLQQNQAIDAAIDACARLARAPATTSTEPVTYNFRNESGRSLTLVPVGEYQGRKIFRTPVILQPSQGKQIELVPGTEVQVLKTSDGTGTALYSFRVGGWDYLQLTDTQALFD